MNTSLQNLAICIALLATLSGCAHFQEHQSRRWTKKAAEQAYEQDPCAQKSGPMARDFERGWRQAYYDVARGSDGEAPILPPQAYWGVKYQNAEGAQQIAAWYEGYLLGASAAHRDGIGLYSVIPTSPLKSCCGPGGCAGCSSCANGTCCDSTPMPPYAAPLQTSPVIPGPVAPVMEYEMPPLSSARPMMQSLPPVEPAPIQLAEARPLHPPHLGARYDGRIQTVGYAEPLGPEKK